VTSNSIHPLDLTFRVPSTVDERYPNPNTYHIVHLTYSIAYHRLLIDTDLSFNWRKLFHRYLCPMSNKNSNPQTGQGVPLPKKENDLFRTVVRQYENKQYKKGMKSADTVLKKFPKHGETLCMKGLILNCMGKKDEAISMVKLGLMNDMR